MEPKFENIVSNLKQNRTYSNYCATENAINGIKHSNYLNVAILRDYTIEPLIPILKGEICLLGFMPSIYLGEYNAIAQEVYNSESELYKFLPNIIIISQWPNQFAPKLFNRYLSFNGRDEIESEIDNILSRIYEIINSIRKNISSPILINNFPTLFRPTLGILDVQNDMSFVNSVNKLNNEIVQISEKFSDVYIIDYMNLFSRIGTENAFDERNWQIGQAPLGKMALVPLGREYGNFFRALKGKSKKCLVLDCDNTLWGGVVGEDLLRGINLDISYSGASYRSFQEEILNLHDRGVIITLCSKNNEEDVLEVIRNHDHMLINESHLSTWQINWDDKVTNIKRIAEYLNIGLDSMVFIDDSEFECNLVRRELPQVEVIQFSKEAYKMKSILSECGFFDSLTYSTEDRKKNKFYQDEGIRKKIHIAANNIEEYLHKLSITVDIQKPHESEIPRISQLTQKTNQFNLTTKRYTENAIEKFINSQTYDIYRLKSRDNISEMGIVAVAIIKYESDHAMIDSFLMSCRAIGRGIEKSFLHFVLSQVITKEKTILAKYIITKKNKQVENFFQNHGFVVHTELENGFVLKFKDFFNFPKWIKLEQIEANGKQ